MKSWISKVLSIEENGDALVELPPEMLDELGWCEEDLLVWEIDGQGRITLRKVENDRYLE